MDPEQNHMLIFLHRKCQIFHSHDQPTVAYPGFEGGAEVCARKI